MRQLAQVVLVRMQGAIDRELPDNLARFRSPRTEKSCPRWRKRRTSPPDEANRTNSAWVPEQPDQPLAGRCRGLDHVLLAGARRAQAHHRGHGRSRSRPADHREKTRAGPRSGIESKTLCQRPPRQILRVAQCHGIHLIWDWSTQQPRRASGKNRGAKPGRFRPNRPPPSGAARTCFPCVGSQR